MSKRALSFAWWLGAAMLALPPLAAAQATQPACTERVFVGGSFIWTSRPAGRQDYHYVTPMFGGSTYDFGVTAGFMLGQHASVAAEVSWVGSLSGPFNFSHWLRQYAMATESETMIGMLVRYHPMKGRVRVEPLGGLYLAIESIKLTDRRKLSDSVPTIVTPLPDVSETATRLGVGFGFDVAVFLTRALALTGSWRLAYFPDRDIPMESGLTASVGVGKQTYQLAGGLRWTFR